MSSCAVGSSRIEELCAAPDGIERAGERDPLPLSSREIDTAPVAGREHRVPTVWQTER